MSINPADFKLKDAVQPWEKIDWSSDRQKAIYCDTGIYFTGRNQNSKAVNYYNKCLEINPDDYRALYLRSVAKRNLSQTQGALKDIRAAIELNAGNLPNAAMNMALCEALNEDSQFMNCKIELHNNERLFVGHKVEEFQNKLQTMNKNIEEAIGESLGLFMCRHKDVFPVVKKLIEREKHIDQRILWKQLRDEGKCDVLSILENSEILVSPREVARRERAFRVLYQMYLTRNWGDVLFLKNLKDNPNLLLKQSKVKSDRMKSYVVSQYNSVKKFLKMLQSRSPFYNKFARIFPNRELSKKQLQDRLFRVQYQTSRNMFTVLRVIREMRKIGNIDKLTDYVETVMGDYTVLKTQRIMPWKLEFINEVYNTVALAHTDGYKLLKKDSVIKNKDFLFNILDMPPLRPSPSSHFVFGDRASYQQPDAVDLAFLKNKEYLSRLLKRMTFARYGIERCYLLHQIATINLKQCHYSECCSTSRKAIEEARNCNSSIWEFLSELQICKAHVALNKIESIRESLNKALVIAQRLKSPELCAFIEAFHSYNEHEILNKNIGSMDSLPKKSAKWSWSPDESVGDLQGSNSSKRWKRETVAP